LRPWLFLVESFTYYLCIYLRFFLRFRVLCLFPPRSSRILWLLVIFRSSVRAYETCISGLGSTGRGRVSYIPIHIPKSIVSTGVTKRARESGTFYVHEFITFFMGRSAVSLALVSRIGDCLFYQRARPIQ
jgi:hypothetical protein